MAQMTSSKKKAYLALASGRVFEGIAFGAEPAENSYGEVVFNTSLTGYQEILTDPSYQGQIVVMTASHIGNYGINPEDVESGKIYLSGFIVQELSKITSNWRSVKSLDQYLRENGIAGITGVDTRALTRHLRDEGASTGLISTDGKDLKKLVKKAKALPKLEGRDLVPYVTSKKSFKWSETTGDWKKQLPHKEAKGKKVVVIDFGVKQNILRCLADRGLDVTVVPATTSAEEILKLNPDGIMLSNGPGDPAEVKYGIATIQKLLADGEKKQKAGEKPAAIFGICLGHQLLGHSLGGQTFKLKFGHHGANHPIKDLEHGNVDITVQNHGFAVEGEKAANGEWNVKGNREAIVTHMNLNDHSVAGLRHKTLPVFSVQYHPEASAGPHDAQHLFDRFIELMEK